MNKVIGMVFVGSKPGGEEEILETVMLAPWELKLDHKTAHDLLTDRMVKSWNSDEQFHARRGYEDFGMRTVVVQ